MLLMKLRKKIRTFFCSSSRAASSSLTSFKDVIDAAPAERVCLVVEVSDGLTVVGTLGFEESVARRAGNPSDIDARGRAALVLEVTIS